jgi:hypothetical protein
MSHPWIMEQMVNEHLNTILKEAEVSRITSPAKREHAVQNSSLKRMVAGLGGLLHGSERQLADQGRISSQIRDCLTPT